MGAGHAIHPGSARVQSSPASPTSGSAQGTAGSVAVSRRRARGNPLAGVHAFAGRPSTRRSLDSAIVKLNEIAEEDVGRRSHRDSIRRFASVVEWTFGVGVVARPQGDSRTGVLVARGASVAGDCIQPPFPGNSLQLCKPVLTEVHAGAGDEILDGARHEHLARRS